MWNGFHFYKVTDDVYNSHQVFTSRFTLFHTSIGKRVSQMVKGFVSSNGKAAIYQSDNIAGIFVSDYVGTLNIEGIAVNIPSKGTYFMNDGGNSVSYYVKEMFINRCVGLNVYSSTTDSTKRFKITVDDTGTLTTTEVTS